MKNNSHEAGAVNTLLIASILLALIAVGFAGFGAWSYSNYLDQKYNVDTISQKRVDQATSDQKTQLEKDFASKYEQPYTKFTGPSDLGSISFDYPKTWSAYQSSSASSDSYNVYFNPTLVPPLTDTQNFALRVTVKNEAYNSVIGDYSDQVTEEKTLTSTPITVNGFTGVKLTGTFSETRTGTAAIFKVRDKTLIIATDTSAFLDKYNDVVLKSLDFNP